MLVSPYFDSRDPVCKTPFGAVCTDQKITLSLHLPKSMVARKVKVVLFPAAEGEVESRPLLLEEVGLNSNIYRAVVSYPKPCVWFYHFEAECDGHTATIMRGHDGNAIVGSGGGWQITVYDKNMRSPGCMGDGVIYQIFPDRFAASGKEKTGLPKDRMLQKEWDAIPEWKPNDAGKVLNNDYFGGDLAGIMDKLDYLAGLGVSCIYLNPIFEAHSNHRYNTADYMKIDPMLGTEKDFAALCKAAGKKGISIVLDGVFSHAGSDSVYFNREGRYGKGGAYKDKESPYHPWFRFYDWPHEYESWWGFITLPNIEETEPSYLEFITGENGVAAKWMRLGAAGFRLDVADELPDVFLDALYKRVKAENKDGVVIGEVWEDASNKVAYGYRRRYLLGAQMDSVMNYPFKDALLGYIRYGGGQSFLGAIMQILENYPPPVIGVLMNSLSTHDTERAITALGGEPVAQNGRPWQYERHHLSEWQYWQGRHRFALASIIQYGLPGMPCVYYGDEAGMYGYKDPFNRACYPWGKEDEGLLSFLKVLGKIRKNNPIFADAKFLPITFSDKLCVFVREGDAVSILFAVNRSDNEQSLALPGGFEKAKAATVYGKYMQGALAAYSGVVLVADKPAKK